MKRIKGHKIKKEDPECSFSQARENEEHDLAYYIHDRVELMHQVFSILKYKEMKTMAPECVRNLAIGDLEELCTEELLGISSKRLLAILDGADPPSDTESSSPSPPPDLETISLDSISSDEELLTSSSSKKKKHKHHRHNSKSKSKKKDKSKEPEPNIEENTELSRASRAGLTVLELLELQARARAIRAQLQQEQAHKHPSETAVGSSHHSSDNDDIEIKEEPPDVVEISSEDEKPDVNRLNKKIAVDLHSKATENETVKESGTEQNSSKVTKCTNDLIVTVPQVKTSRKIKLKRNNVSVSVLNNSNSPSEDTGSITIAANLVANHSVASSKNIPEKNNESKSKKKKKDKKRKTSVKDGSDHDEITLQLSDSEKMDLFENLDESRKNYDKVSSSSEDTESSSSDSEADNTCNKNTAVQISPTHTNSSIVENIENNSAAIETHKENKPEDLTENLAGVSQDGDSNSLKENDNLNNQNECIPCDVVIDPNMNSFIEDQNINHSNECDKAVDPDINENITENVTLVSDIIVPKSDTVLEKSVNEETTIINDIDSSSKRINEGQSIQVSSIEDIQVLSDSVLKNQNAESQGSPDKDKEVTKDNKNDEIESTAVAKLLSDGELSDRPSSEVEAIDLQSDIVCISDEDSSKKQNSKKKKKKEKKTKKDKKSKKEKLDFRKGSDENFYKDENSYINAEKDLLSRRNKDECIEQSLDLDNDDVYEILELSDDSSCYEVEGTVLSKEPTAEEIEALSAKIDEIEQKEVVNDQQIREYEQMMAEKDNSSHTDDNIDKVSWKDRYLGSNKVKKVLTTANILNALRKKNKELKKKIEDSKIKDLKEIISEENTTKETNVSLEEGSIEQYNTLQGSNKYVDPVKDALEESNLTEDNKIDGNNAKTSLEENVTKEMKKDAKQLLKMYKRLLKHNDMNKQKHPHKKKKKKKDKHNEENKITNPKVDT